MHAISSLMPSFSFGDGGLARDHLFSVYGITVMKERLSLSRIFFTRWIECLHLVKTFVMHCSS